MAVGTISQKMLLNNSKDFSILCLVFYIYLFSTCCTGILYFVEWLNNVKEFRNNDHPFFVSQLKLGFQVHEDLLSHNCDLDHSDLA